MEMGVLFVGHIKWGFDRTINSRRHNIITRHCCAGDFFMTLSN